MAAMHLLHIITYLSFGPMSPIISFAVHAREGVEGAVIGDEMVRTAHEVCCCLNPQVKLESSESLPSE